MPFKTLLKYEIDVFVGSLILMVERIRRDIFWVANPNGTASYARSRDASIHSPALRLAPYTAMYRASCVSLPLRSAKPPLQANMYRSTDSLRLPRKTVLGHVVGHTIPHAGHVKRTPRARIPTPVPRKHARGTSDGHHSPHLPRETHA